MSKFKIYLAGRMSGLSLDEMCSWREESTKLLKQYDDSIHTENPCHYYNFEIDPNSYTDKEVKEFDLHLVRHCDLILVNLDFPDSIGTAIELHMGHDEWRKPVIGFGTVKNHPWIEFSLTKRCGTMEDAIQHIIDFYLPNK